MANAADLKSVAARLTDSISVIPIKGKTWRIQTELYMRKVGII